MSSEVFPEHCPALLVNGHRRKASQEVQERSCGTRQAAVFERSVPRTAPGCVISTLPTLQTRKGGTEGLNNLLQVTYPAVMVRGLNPGGPAPEATLLTPPIPASVLPRRLPSRHASLHLQTHAGSKSWGGAFEAVFSFSPHLNPRRWHCSHHPPGQEQLHSLPHITQPVRAEPGRLPGLSDSRRSGLP